MDTQQKAFVVRIRPDSTHGLDELNVQLGRGWRVVKMAPMGGAAVGSREGDEPELCLATLVVIERHEEAAADMMAQVETEPEEVVDELVEGETLSSEKLSQELEEERNGGRL